ncbi:hypothetical protein MKX03_028786, partial [Papaver bracteatum]
MGYSEKMMVVVMIMGVLMVEEISAQNIPTCAASLVPSPAPSSTTTSSPPP